jgi:hypothetical protein
VTTAELFENLIAIVAKMTEEEKLQLRLSLDVLKPTNPKDPK